MVWLQIYQKPDFQEFMFSHFFENDIDFILSDLNMYKQAFSII